MNYCFHVFFVPTPQITQDKIEPEKTHEHLVTKSKVSRMSATGLQVCLYHPILYAVLGLKKTTLFPLNVSF